jgi:hypothetical protein
VILAATACAPSRLASPEGRAAEFLAREVRRWPEKNKCFSCHNNGDGARALYAASRRSVRFDPRAVEETTRYLQRPDEWKYNGPEGRFSDKRLAAVQFAGALAAAVEAGAAERGPALDRAAEIVRSHQEADGSWKVDESGLPGSPATYGRALATVMARKVLEAADPARFAEAIGRADAWMKGRKPDGVLEAAALLAGTNLEGLDLLRRGQTRDGGWGPYVTSPPETFDTAIALLGLAGVRGQEGVPEMIRRGREFVLKGQQRDGSWPETTRPPGAESYAQRISTTAWATLALLETAPR